MTYLMFLLSVSEGQAVVTYVPACGYTPIGALIHDARESLTTTEIVLTVMAME